MITPSFSLTATERAFPALALDFTTGALDPRITFARALGTATVVDSSGLIAGVAADTPRFDYDPITKACRGLLIEETRTNIVRQSEDFNTTWTKSNMSVTTNTHVAPDGTTTADTIAATANNANVSWLRSITSGVAYSFSVFAKKIDSDTFQISFSNVAAGPTFTFSSETFTSVPSGWTATFEKFDNGWYRLMASRLSTTTFAGIQFTVPTNGQSVALWGAQWEQGAFATSYIPVTTANVTRNADVATMTGTNFSDWWQAGKGSALVRARPSIVSGIRPLIQFDDATADNIIALRGNTTNPELYIRSGGSDQAQIDAGTIAANISYRLAGAWAENSCAASLNSGTPVLDGVATIPTVTQARLGSDGTNYLSGHIRAIEYYDERIPSSALQVMSSTAGYQSIIGSVFRGAIIL